MKTDQWKRFASHFIERRLDIRETNDFETDNLFSGFGFENQQSSMMIAAWSWSLWSRKFARIIKKNIYIYLVWNDSSEEFIIYYVDAALWRQLNPHRLNSWRIYGMNKQQTCRKFGDDFFFFFVQTTHLTRAFMCVWGINKMCGHIKHILDTLNSIMDRSYKHYIDWYVCVQNDNDFIVIGRIYRHIFKKKSIEM